MFDIVIKGALIADGTGSCPYTGDLGITNSKISVIDNLDNVNAREEINASGLVLAPGFIDIHGHSEYSLLLDPQAQSKVQQGITTEICGNCGFSAAPLVGTSLLEEQKHIDAKYGIKIKWDSFDGFLNFLKTKDLTINVGSLVGHGILRSGIIGYHNKKATPEELSEMGYLLEKSLDEGAFGCSTGLIYVPSSFADLNELSFLMKIVAKKEGVYTTHIRSEGETLFQAVDEAINVAINSGVSLQISHLKVGKVHWGKSNELLKLIEKARSNGTDITVDQYPYTASCTSLSASLPLWAREGTNEDLKKRLINPELKIKAVTEANDSFNRNYDDILLSYLPEGELKNYEGKKITFIAARTNLTPGELIVKIVSKVGNDANAIYFSMQEDDVATIMKWPWTFIATDSEARSFNGSTTNGSPHPRTYGTYPRILGRYVRDKKVLALEEAIKKMTYLPAKKFGITDRGIIKKGAWADLVLLNPLTILDQATYESPKALPAGIIGVWVNGKKVVSKGQLTGLTPGMVLKKKA